MKIKFKNIKISNFLSFGECEVDLQNPGYTLVSGINNNTSDNATANGVGKSAIFNAICWVLCGETIQGLSKDITNINGDDGAFVELLFSVDNDTYKITRTKDHSKYKTNLIIFKNDENISGKGIRDTEKILSEHLPDLTSDLIGSVIILGQGLPHRFSDNTPSARKEILEKLSKSDFMIADIKTRLIERKSELQISLSQVEKTLIEYSTEKSLLEKQLQESKVNLTSLGDIGDIKSEMDLCAQESCSLISDRQSIEANLEEHRKKEKEFLNSYSELLAEERTIRGWYDIEYDSQIVPIRNSINELVGEGRALQTELHKLNSVKDICPTCGQKITGVHKPDTSGLEARLSEISATIDLLKEKSNNIINNLDEEKNRKLSQLEPRIKFVTDNIDLCQDIAKADETHIKDINSRISSLQATYSANEAKLQAYNSTKDKILSTIETIEKRLIELEANILYNNNEKDNINTRVDIIGKMLTMATRDFRGYLLTNVVEYICQRSKIYCKDIFNTEKINICLNGNNIDITYDNKNYENLSGGEKQRIDIIIQLSIRDMLCTFMNFSSSIIVLDEIFDNLDELGSQKVLDVISNRLKDVESIYIITHHSDIPVPTDNEIIIVKDNNGISRIM